MTNYFDRVFHLLDKWRHLPNYQLERRADVYFAIFLRDFLQFRTGSDLQEILIPEFPIKRDLIWPDHPTHKSVKVDYVLFSDNRANVYFVELKTDRLSRRKEQDRYLDRCTVIGFERILRELLSITGRTKYRQKYYHLLHAIADAGYLKIPDGLEAALFPDVKRNAGGLIDQIDIL